MIIISKKCWWVSRSEINNITNRWSRVGSQDPVKFRARRNVTSYLPTLYIANDKKLFTKIKLSNLFKQSRYKDNNLCFNILLLFVTDVDIKFYSLDLPSVTDLKAYNIGINAIYLTWSYPQTLVDGSLEYEVIIQDYNSNKIIATMKSSNTNATVNGLLPNKAYFIKVNKIVSLQYTRTVLINK